MVFISTMITHDVKPSTVLLNELQVCLVTIIVGHYYLHYISVGELHRRISGRKEYT